MCVSRGDEMGRADGPTADVGSLIPSKPGLVETPEEGRPVWATHLCWVVSQTRVCDTGPQFTPFSLFRCGSQRYSAIRTLVVGRAMPERPTATSAPAAPESPSCRAVTRKPNASSCWPPAWRFLTSIRTSASPGPPVLTVGGAGTLWTPGCPQATPWLWSPSTASGGAGWTRWGTSTTFNGAG